MSTLSNQVYENQFTPYLPPTLLNPNNQDLYANTLTLSNTNSNISFEQYRNFTINCSCTGPYSAPVATTVTVTIEDNRVFISFPQIAANAGVSSSSITITPVTAFPIPISAPNGGTMTYFPVVLSPGTSNSGFNTSESIGMGLISTTGANILINSLQGTYFGGTAGYRAFSLMYLTTLVQ